ncbi:MAG: RES domain-containing protein [Planctomycetaceae bacterium]
MDVWRICKAKHSTTAFTGMGAEVAGGRWNHKGHKVIYTSSNLSLASLEYFVHISAQTAPEDLVTIRARIPDDVSREEIVVANLPENWKNYPAIAALKEMGSDWVKRGETLLLRVPSAITPEESNYLINPGHHEFERITYDSPVKFTFDRRMWK